LALRSPALMRWASPTASSSHRTCSIDMCAPPCYLTRYRRRVHAATGLHFQPLALGRALQLVSFSMMFARFFRNSGEARLWSAEIRAMAALAWPMVLTNVAQTAMTVTDVMMMGWLGPRELAAGTLGANLYF